MRKRNVWRSHGNKRVYYEYQESREYMTTKSQETPVSWDWSYAWADETSLNPQDDLKYYSQGTNGRFCHCFLYSVLSGAGYRIGRCFAHLPFLQEAGWKFGKQDQQKRTLLLIILGVWCCHDKGWLSSSLHLTRLRWHFCSSKRELWSFCWSGNGRKSGPSTNIKNTLLAVLVSISMDHMSFLEILLWIAESRDHQDGCRVVTCRQAGSNAGDWGGSTREHGANVP